MWFILFVYVGSKIYILFYIKKKFYIIIYDLIMVFLRN